MNGIMKRIDSMDDEMLEAPGRCDYELDDETCIASATRFTVATTPTRIAGVPVRVEFPHCDEHRDALRQQLIDGDVFTIDSEHTQEHQCAAVYASERAETTVFRCDCGSIVGVE